MCMILISTCAISYAEIKIIKFATRGIYAPFSKLHTNEEQYGFDIDIAKELCKRLQTQCVFSADQINESASTPRPPPPSRIKYRVWVGLGRLLSLKGWVASLGQVHSTNSIYVHCPYFTDAKIKGMRTAHSL